MHLKPERKEMEATKTGLNHFVRRDAELTRMSPTGGKPICPSCRFRVRGPNHEEGSHHQQGGRQGKSKVVRYRRR